MVIAQCRQQSLYSFQRLLAADIAGDGHDLLRGQAMVIAQCRQQSLYSFKGLLTAFIAGNHHDLHRSQVQWRCRQHIARCMQRLQRGSTAIFCNLQQLACDQL